MTSISITSMAITTTTTSESSVGELKRRAGSRTRPFAFQRMLIVIIALCVCVPALAAAQLPSLESTIRFRRGDTTEWRQATLLRIAPDSLIVRVCDKCADSLVNVTPISAYSLEWRHVRWARAGHIAAGVVTGAVAGAALDLGLIGLCSTQPQHGDGPGCGVAIIFLPGFALGGAVAGGIVGAFLPGSSWEPITVAR